MPAETSCAGSEAAAELAALAADALPEAWSEAAFRDTLASHGAFAELVRNGAGELLAAALVRVCADEAELLFAAVRPDARRAGLARRAVRAALERARTRGAERAFLEVRASNAAAHALYGSLDFEPVATRRAYYPDGEDARAMRLDLIPAGPALTPPSSPLSR